jgi:hypothetical protein
VPPKEERKLSSDDRRHNEQDTQPRKEGMHRRITAGITAGLGVCQFCSEASQKAPEEAKTTKERLRSN